MNRILLFSLLLCGLSPAQITFSEIMYNPAGSEFHDEFIELYNGSDSTVDLSGWTVGDSNSVDEIIGAGQGTLWLPGSFAVILDGSYWGNSTRYNDRIPETALTVTIDGKAFLTNGLTNSTPKTLLLRDNTGRLVSRYRYETGYEEDHSAEKIILTEENNRGNWGMSLRAGGTPGKRNSLSPYDYDLSLRKKEPQWSPYLIQAQNTFSLSFFLFNTGLKAFGGHVTLRATFSAPLSITVFDEQVKPPPPGDSLRLGFEHIFSRGGRYALEIVLSSAEDENPLNDTLALELNVLETDARMAINEIKFLTREDEPEWLEILNAGDFRLSLLGWAIADRRDTARIDTLAYIDPGQLKILAPDRAITSLYDLADTLVITLRNWPTLNNSSDIVYLLDPLDRWVEQVPYAMDWLEGMEEDKPSLERINSALEARLARSWGPCILPEGATPGRRNSIFGMPSVTEKGSLRVSPDPFSPDNDGFEDYCLISFTLPVNSARMRLRVYDVRGRLVRSITENRFSGQSQSMVWDGRDDRGRLLPMGIYIIYLQIINDRNGVIAVYKKSITLARRLN